MMICHRVHGGDEDQGIRREQTLASKSTLINA